MLAKDFCWSVQKSFERRIDSITSRKIAKKYGHFVLYVASHCLPYHANGYAYRTQEILCASRARGDNVQALTRPGYPWDRNTRSAIDAPVATSIDGICYHHIRSIGRHWPLFIYASLAARKIGRHIADQNIGIVHAASNHVNALPALLAAKKVGIPFHYEIRGFWEFSKAASCPNFERSGKFRRGLALERLVALRADKVYAISEQVALYIRENFGVPADRVELLPNCVAQEFLDHKPDDLSDPPVITYAGSLNDYEGLDLLLVALSQLRSRCTGWSLIIAGDGPARSALQKLTEELGLSRSVSFLGRVPKNEALEAVARSSVVCLPRKSTRVCELVPPLKLVEAMAMGKPVIIPDLPVFRDELGNSDGGFFFRAGDCENLAEVLHLALSHPSKFREIGRRAHDHIASRRIWTHHLPDVWKNPADYSDNSADA